MVIIRPIQASDYNALHRIAVESGHGFTSLPVNQTLLEQRISHSQKSFQQNISTATNQSYLFVLEDLESQQVVGTSAIKSAVGLDDTFYHYHLGKVVHHSRELGVYNTVETLSLCNDYTGASELCTLFLCQSHRKNRNGKFLSRVRFLFMAEHMQRFSNTVIAEMRGVSDEQGRSPFWHWLESNFFSMDFPTVDYLCGIGKKEFIAELMPKYPIYVNLLSKEAQTVINKVHKNTEPALHLLEAEGFTRRGYVDIFDAGPTIEASLESIKTIKQSRKYQVLIGDVSEPLNYIIANTKVVDFRAIQAPLSVHSAGKQVTISQSCADALQIKEHDWVRIIAN